MVANPQIPTPPTSAVSKAMPQQAPSRRARIEDPGSSRMMKAMSNLPRLSPLLLGHAFEIGDGHAGHEHADGLAPVHDRHGDLDGVRLERLVEPRFRHLPRLARAHRHLELLLALVDVADRLLGEGDLLALGAVEERLVEGA